MLGRRRHLAEKRTAKEAVARRGPIRRRHVGELVIHQVVHPLVRGEGFVRETERRNLDRDDVVGYRIGCRVAEVGKVGEQDIDPFAGVEVEQLAVKIEGVLGGSCSLWREKALRRVEIDDADVASVELAELRDRSVLRRGEKRQREEAARDQ